jgi:2-octaprenyl-6-methoxyphenol hydroxylase
MVAHQDPVHVWVSGAGPTGSLAALALAKWGCRVTLHDPNSAELLIGRHRAYALTHSSRSLFSRLQLWEEVQGVCQAFHRLELCDQSNNRKVSFAPGHSVGWVLNHQELQRILLRRCKAHPSITMHLGSPAGGAKQADLTVLAEGGNSSGRGALGIPFRGFRYGQACVTAQMLIQGLNDHTAWEVFRPEGPLAVLPMGDGRAQVVWSAPLQRCRQRCDLSDKAFIAELNKLLPAPLNAAVLLDKPSCFPVEWRLASRLGRGTTLLCGETAHRCHPVGGQGLNLCWRDVASLEVLATRLGRSPSPAACRRLVASYSRRRWLDLFTTLAATDLLIRLFSNENPPLRWLRGRILALLAGNAQLQKQLLKLASHGLAGDGLTKEGHRLNNNRLKAVLTAICCGCGHNHGLSPNSFSSLSPGHGDHHRATTHTPLGPGGFPAS